MVFTTFTKAAAREARDRALAKFMNYHPDDFLWFSTIHSICFRLLGLDRSKIFTGKKLAEFCSAYGYEISSDDEEDRLETELPCKVLETDVDYFEHFISWQRNLMLDFDTAYKIFTRQMDTPPEFNLERLKDYIRRRNEYKADNNLFDFTDLLELVLENKMRPSRVKVIIQDEYQDLSPLLAKVAELWSRDAERCYFGGDPHQAIYAFMGADPSIFLNSRADKTFVLKQSYRCPKAAHDLSRVIVSRFNVRYPDDDFIPKDKEGMVLRTVPERIDWSNIEGKVFYLHRTHYLLSQVFNDLLLDGVPFATIRGRKSPLQTAKASVVSSIFKLLNAKYIPIADVVKIMDYLPSKTPRETYLKPGAKTECRKAAQDKPYKNISFKDLPDLGFTKDFFSYFKPERILYPFKLSDDEKAYFTRLIRNYGVSVLETEPKLILSTYHGVKGMECDTVIINPNLTRKTYEALLSDPDAEHRLFYVGVTRSRDKVILLEPKSYQSYHI